MARPPRRPSPRLAALLGEDTTRHLVSALGPDSARDLDSQLGELHQHGQLKAIRFQLQLQAGLDQVERRQLAERLETLDGKLSALDGKLDLITRLFEQYASDQERIWLESHGCVVQLNEVFRVVRNDVRQLPHTVAAATAIAVGAAIVPEVAPAPPPAPIVLVARERGEAA